MIEPGDNRQSARETAQPSLWDRLLNDLPGVSSEIDGLHAALGDELGPARVEALVAGGRRAVEAEKGLAPRQKEQLVRLIVQIGRRAELEARGIVVSSRVLREAVRRDIEALFNTERFEGTPLMTPAEAKAHPDRPPSLADFPEVRRSVINYGVPPFAGRSAKDFDQGVLVREIKTVLAAFEPRLKESATQVTVTTSDKAGLSIEISGLLILAPVPERLVLRTLVDLETGQARTSLREA
jgi:type VI secretion system protein ImpF